MTDSLASRSPRFRFRFQATGIALGLSIAPTFGCAAQAPAPTVCAEAATQTNAAPKDEAAPEDKVAAAEALAERARELFDVPGLALGVVVGDELVLAKGFGVRELGQAPLVDANTSFAIASNTKAFTATAVGMLVAEGKLDWDDRVVDHLPEFELWDPYLTRELRVRDLLSHRVGLDTWAGDLLWISSNYDRKTVMSRLKHLPARWGLREHYGYCNLMFMVAGELVERRSGQPWDAYLRDKLLSPLGMREVSTRVGELKGRDNVATPHIKVAGEWQTTGYLNLEAVGPAASFHANVQDMSQWIRMQLADGEFEGAQVVPSSVIRETRQPHIWLELGEEDFYAPRRHLAGYGLGWYLADYRGETAVWHGGGMPGMTSRVLLFPESNVGVVVLTSSESAVSSVLALQVADLFLSEAGSPRKDYLGAMHEMTQAGAEEPAPPLLDGAPPKGLEGAWSNPILGDATIVSDASGTWFEVPKHGGLRCRLYAGPTKADAKAPQQSVPCAWTDPNMGVSDFRLERKGNKVRSLSFQVRPDFYDPLRYRFER